MTKKNKVSNASVRAAVVKEEDARRPSGTEGAVSSQSTDFLPPLLVQYIMPLIAAALIYLIQSNLNTLDELLLTETAEHQSGVCGYVMAESALGGWGVFSMKDIIPSASAAPILYSDVKIHLVDIQPHQYDGLAQLIENYAWSANVGRGEGTSVISIQPGMGMLANAYPMASGVLAVPGLPLPSRAGFRGTPLQGATTLYHGQFFPYQPIVAGSEIFIEFGSAFQSSKILRQPTDQELIRPVEKLKQDGLCLDNLQPLLSEERGYGAFAVRNIARNQIIAPVPVLPVNRTSLEMLGGRKQLLLNYCFGHERSSLLLYPYSPVVNFLNHYYNSSNQGNKDQSPNARIRWSSGNRAVDATNMAASKVLSNRTWGLLLEIVATKDITKGDEVVIDYGTAWQQAWERHVASFVELDHSDYEYPAILNQFFSNGTRQVEIIKTYAEQLEAPYPSNIETSCYYEYKTADKIPYPDAEFDPTSSVTWAFFPPTTYLQASKWRPCYVVEHYHDDNTYMVDIRNRAGQELDPVPAGERHLVDRVPRDAIRFVDKSYTTDQNLQGAFRKEIGLAEGVFPISWMDLK